MPLVVIVAFDEEDAVVEEVVVACCWKVENTHTEQSIRDNKDTIPVVT